MPISYISKEGFEKIESELKFLMGKKRREIAKEIDVARSFGDLSENAEYDAAKEKQNLNEIRIGELAERIQSLQILDDTKIDKTKAFLGATVKLYDMVDKEDLEYIIVAEAEADILENKISVASPLGKGMLGHKVKDVIKLGAGKDVQKYKIMEISR